MTSQSRTNYAEMNSTFKEKVEMKRYIKYMIALLNVMSELRKT